MKIRHITSGLQFPEGPIAMDDGSVLLVEIARGTLSRVTPDGRIHVVSQMGGGPNGAAIGPDGAVYVCNNGGFECTTEIDGCLRPTAQARDYAGGRIERVDLATGKFERLFDSGRRRGPARAQRHRLRRRTAASTSPTWARCAHTRWTMAACTTHGAGGAAARTHRAAGAHAQRRGAVAGRPHAVLRRDRRRAAVGLRHRSAGPGAQAPVAIAARRAHAGGLAGRALPALRLDGRRRPRQPARGHADARRHQRRSRPTARRHHHVPLDDRFVTNLCFGGRDLRTVYVTLSGSGRLIAIDGWPTAGLRLNYNA